MKSQCYLLDKKCVPCEGGTPPLTEEMVNTLLKEVEGWNVLENKKIEKKYKFKNFKEAMGFMNKVAELAEQEGHHPDIRIYNWNKVQISLSTHAIKGLSENDFILAAKIDYLI